MTATEQQQIIARTRAWIRATEQQLETLRAENAMLIEHNARLFRLYGVHRLLLDIMRQAHE